MSSLLRIALPALAVVLIAGCGYRNTRSGPVVLPENNRRLFIEEVENPTLMTSLNARLRSLLRDEMTRRGNFEWVARENAEAFVQVEIVRFTSSSTVTGAEGQTLRSAAVITIEGTIVDAVDRSVLWSSGQVSASQSFIDEREAAEDRVILLAVERLVDKLGQDF
jgi:hypothetical protein